MPILGLEAPKKEIDALFDQFDPDGGGSITYDELKKALRGGAGAATGNEVTKKGFKKAAAGIKAINAIKKDSA